MKLKIDEAKTVGLNGEEISAGEKLVRIEDKSTREETKITRATQDALFRSRGSEKYYDFVLELDLDTTVTYAQKIS